MMIFEEKDVRMSSNALDGLYFEDILNLVDHLPNATQKVFRLYAIEGYTHVEVGEILNISPGTSKWHLSEGRKLLKALIKKNNISSKHAG
jgi:RNA polymerase sigma-70 factor (ECF subfamily)